MRGYLVRFPEIAALEVALQAQAGRNSVASPGSLRKLLPAWVFDPFFSY